MAIVSSSYDPLQPHAGRFRTRLHYTFTDGRSFSRGPVHVEDEAQAKAVLSESAPGVQLMVQGMDSDEALQAGIMAAFGEASQNQVFYAYLMAGWEQDEPYKAYMYMKDVAPVLLSLGLTDEEYAGLLGVPVDEATSVRLRWEYLDANKAAILAYISVVEGIV